MMLGGQAVLVVGPSEPKHATLAATAAADKSVSQVSLRRDRL